ncbi:MAG: glycosyltransferase [Thermodesulfobacteriota bacterium]
MKPPLILHCLDGLGIGGAERQLILLLRHLPRETFAHAVCHLGPRQDLAAPIRAMGIPVFDLSRGRRYSPIAVARLLLLVRRQRPALIHADHDFGKFGARIAGALMRIPVLATMGNTVAEPHAVPGRRRVSARARLLDWADRIVSDRTPHHYLAISQAVKRSLMDDGVLPDQISVVYRGVDPSDFVPDTPERLSSLRRTLLPEGAGPILLNVGRLTEQKGQDTLIRAMPVILRLRPHARLVLVGEGPSRDAYLALARRKGVAGHVQLLGSRLDVPDLLQVADVFVFPSRREGFGCALLEAMAAGRPCVASRIPTLQEVMGTDGAGVLVPPGRPDLFAEAILSLLEDPARRALMGRRAREIVTERFDIGRSALDFAELCHRVISVGRARTPAEAVS